MVNTDIQSDPRAWVTPRYRHEPHDLQTNFPLSPWYNVVTIQMLSFSLNLIHLGSILLEKHLVPAGRKIPVAPHHWTSFYNITHSFDWKKKNTSWESIGCKVWFDPCQFPVACSLRSYYLPRLSPRNNRVANQITRPGMQPPIWLK
jgi:hypothetical protein